MRRRTCGSNGCTKQKLLLKHLAPSRQTKATLWMPHMFCLAQPRTVGKSQLSQRQMEWFWLVRQRETNQVSGFGNRVHGCGLEPKGAGRLTSSSSPLPSLFFPSPSPSLPPLSPVLLSTPLPKPS